MQELMKIRGKSARAERFFNSEGGWFCSTRNGENIGPFGSRAEAEQELVLFLRSLSTRPDGLRA